jgi:uncharacterized lipoprotein YajG
MKKILVIMATVMLLSACGTAPTKPAPTSTPESAGDLSTQVTWVQLPDNRRVLCVFQSSSYANGGISCDWAGARAQ